MKTTLSKEATREEIIAAGLIAICKECEDVEYYATVAEVKSNPLFNHWYSGKAFDYDISNMWMIVYCDKGILTGGLINY